MAAFQYASFPNSRSRNRSPTIQANTVQKTVNEYALPMTLLSPANLNRTYLNVENTDDQLTVMYVYANPTVIDPTAVPTNGVPNQLLYNVGADILYQKQDEGTTTNWVVVTKQSVGRKLFPYQNATLDALQNIYGFVDSAVAASAVLDLDEGRG